MKLLDGRVGVSRATTAVVAVLVAIIVGAGTYFAKPTTTSVVTQTLASTGTVTVSGTTTVTVSGAPSSGITIWWIGGASGDPFDARLEKGATDAANMLGVNLVYVHTNWDPSQTIAQFKNAIAAKPNGIVVDPLPGDQAMAPLVKQAVSEGIYVTYANVDAPTLRNSTYWFSGYVGQQLYQAGFNLANEAFQLCGLKAGERAAIFSASWNLPTRAQRIGGAYAALKQDGMIIDNVSHPSSVYSSPDQGIPYVTGYYGAHPDVKLIIFDGGGTTAAVETYMKAIGAKPGQICVAGFDLTPGSVQAIEDGYLQVVIDQQPYLQGYLSVINLYLSIKYGFSGLFIDTGGSFITAQNVKSLAPLVNEGYR